MLLTSTRAGSCNVLSPKFTLLCLVPCLISYAFAWSDEFDARVKTGAQRITDIGKAGADTNRFLPFFP